MPAGFYNGEVMFADNVRFDGGTQPGQVTTNGQLLIGSTVAPNIRVGNLLTPNAGSTVTFDYSSPNINLNVTTTVLGNTTIGLGSGNGTISGGQNTALGYATLAALTSGANNTAIGFNSMLLIQGGASNTALGHGSLGTNVSGGANTSIGYASLSSNTGSNNVAVGVSALQSFGGNNSTAVGYLACRDTTGTGNTILGFIGLVNNTSGTNNTGVGYQTFAYLSTGSNNTAIGYDSGSALTTNDSGNLLLDHVGVVGDNNVTRIGTNQTTCYIQGISGVTVAASVPVLIDAAGQMGTILSSERYKENIVDMPESLSVLDLRPVQFNYKPEYSPLSIPETQYGLIAEEVAKDFPYLAIYKDGQPETVKYHELCVFLLAEIQRLEARVTMLEAK